MNRREAIIRIGVASIDLALPKPKFLPDQPNYDEIWRAQPEALRKGGITHYGPGVMEEVVKARLRMNHLDEATVNLVSPGYWIATLHRNEVGSFVWLQVKDYSVGPVLVVDCVGRKDLPNHVAAGRIGEVSYLLAQQLDIVGQPTLGIIRTIPVPRTQKLYPF